MPKPPLSAAVCLPLLLSLAGVPTPRIATFAQKSAAIQTDRQHTDQAPADSTIKVDATLVNVPMTIRDAQGHYPAGLQQNDFTVFENGVKQQLDFFSAETVPFQVVLVLDVSASTMPFLWQIKQTALAFVSQLRPADQVMVITVASDIKVQNNFTSDQTILRRAINNATASGATRLYDAILMATRDKLKPLAGRKALIVLTDGDDTGSYMSAKYALDEAQEADALIYVVRYPERNSPLAHADRSAHDNHGSDHYPYPFPYDFIGELIERTGGTLYEARSVNNLQALTSNIAAELHHVYTLAYYPSNAIQNGGYRKIQVKLPQYPKLKVHCKAGYDASALRAAQSQHPDQTDQPTSKSNTSHQ